jgi:hypothetical protein
MLIAFHNGIYSSPGGHWHIAFLPIVSNLVAAAKSRTMQRDGIVFEIKT